MISCLTHLYHVDVVCGVIMYEQIYPARINVLVFEFSLMVSGNMASLCLSLDKASLWMGHSFKFIYLFYSYLSYSS